MNLGEANIIITGAGSGFGKAMSLCFSSKGASVFAIDVNNDSLKALKKEDSEIQIYSCDIVNNEKVELKTRDAFRTHSKQIIRLK